MNRVSARTKSGYVLLLVLAVSVLVITTLSTLANLSLRRSLAAADAQRSLQQRWGAVTLERAMLARASEVFQLQEELAAERTPGVPPPSSIRAALTLNGVTFDLLLGDEDAKLNLNALYHRNGLGSTQRALADIVGPSQSVALRPAASALLIAAQMPSRTRGGNLDSEQAEEIPDAFRSWGEVFDLTSLHRQGQAALPSVTTGITCWGTGQLNFRRASDQAILAIARSVVQDGGARRLLQRYRNNPAASLGVLLQTEVSNQQNRQRLLELMSQSSTNFSLWVDASSNSGRSHRQFTVMRRDEEGVIRQSKFSF